MTEWLNVGKIVNTHGINGEVRVISKTDFPEKRYQVGSILSLYDQKSHTPLKVQSWRQHKQFDLLTFEGYANLNDVEPFKGSILQVDKASLDDQLAKDEFYYHEIIGLHVYTDEKIYVGKIKEILSPGANDVWVVDPENKRKDILIPYIDSVVKTVSVEEKLVIITPMEGMLDE